MDKAESMPKCEPHELKEAVFDHYLDMYSRIERGQLLSENSNHRYTSYQLQMYRASVMAGQARQQYKRVKEMWGTFILGTMVLVPLNFAIVCQLKQYPTRMTLACRELAAMNIIMTNWFVMCHYNKAKSHFLEPIKREKVDH